MICILPLLPSSSISLININDFSQILKNENKSYLMQVKIYEFILHLAIWYEENHTNKLNILIKTFVHLTNDKKLRKDFLYFLNHYYIVIKH